MYLVEIIIYFLLNAKVPYSFFPLNNKKIFKQNHKSIMSLHNFLQSSAGKGWYMMSNITDGFIV